MKTLPIHTDIIGREIAIDDYVSTYDWKTLKICRVIKINPKTVKLLPFGCQRTINKRGIEVTLLPLRETTFHILNKSD